MYTPETDGIDHINIYTKGETKLGRDLTNLSNVGFTYPDYGTFKSMEGFWYYYLTGCQFRELTNTNGFQSKSLGKTLKEFRVDKEGLTEGHKEVLKEGIRCKLRQNKHLLEDLISSDLPFSHYYYYGSKDNPKVYYLPQFDWIVDEITRIREICKQWRNK